MTRRKATGAGKKKKVLDGDLGCNFCCCIGRDKGDRRTLRSGQHPSIRHKPQQSQEGKQRKSGWGFAGRLVSWFVYVFYFLLPPVLYSCTPESQLTRANSFICFLRIPITDRALERHRPNRKKIAFLVSPAPKINSETTKERGRDPTKRQTATYWEGPLLGIQKANVFTAPLVENYSKFPSSLIVKVILAIFTWASAQLSVVSGMPLPSVLSRLEHVHVWHAAARRQCCGM